LFNGDRVLLGEQSPFCNETDKASCCVDATFFLSVNLGLRAKRSFQPFAPQLLPYLATGRCRNGMDWLSTFDISMHDISTAPGVKARRPRN
jgi:hypothetical protein